MHDRPLNAVRARAGLVAALVAILVVGLLPPAALADHNADGADPCAEAPPATDFADYEEASETHRPSIDCALYRGITAGSGTNPEGAPVYRPDQQVTREQMAQFIVNTIVSAGYGDALPGGEGADEFDDIGDSFARVAINQLARASIVRGTGGDRYSPHGTVTRQQMASFIVQAARYIVGEQHPIRRDGADRFRDVDDDNVHKENIEAGADAGLFQGTSATTFSPRVRVPRDQMATFLVNLLEYSFNPDQAPPPYTAQVNISDTNVAAGGTLAGDITGTNVESATVTGCGLDDAALTDRDGGVDGIQFEVTIPADQPAGECLLTFSVTFTNNAVRQPTRTITVAAGNSATVTLDSATAHPGAAVTGEITGSSIASASVSGCGLNNATLQDRDTSRNGIQFSVTIPPRQPPGACTLTFTITYQDGETEAIPKDVTVVERTGVTTLPELVGADIVSTASTGTTVRYLFDESVTGGSPAAGNFALYAFDSSRETGSTARVESGNTRSVLVTFPNLTTTGQVEDQTVAAVLAGAVTDDQGQDNPAGGVPIGVQRDETVRQPGATAAPDLQNVGPFRSVDDDTTAVDYTFDEAAYVFDPSGFHLVMVDGTVVNCTGPEPDATTGSGGSQPGGNGTPRITATCPNPGSGDQTVRISATNVARGYVDSETVSDGAQTVEPPVGDTPEGTTNPLQAAPVAAAGATPGPDLVSATFTPGAGGADDRVVYTFDEVIQPLADENPVTNEPTVLFLVYDTTGEEHEAETAERGGNTTQVVATFENGTLADAVGASVRAGAVQAATEEEQANRPDDVGVTNATTRTITPGRTAGPDLVAVAVNPADGSATYTFDEEVNSSPAAEQPPQPMDFFLYLSNGIELQCFGVPGTGTFTVDGAKVTCSQYRQGNGQATDAQVGSAVLGTVRGGAVDDAEDGVTENPEGAVATTGGTGRPEQ